MYYGYLFYVVMGVVSLGTCMSLYLYVFLFVLSYSSLFVLFHIIFFYCIIGTLGANLFSYRRQKGCGSRWEGMWEESVRCSGRGNHNQNVLDKTPFLIIEK